MSGIFGGSSIGTHYFQPHENVLDISRFAASDLAGSGLEKAIVSGAGYYSAGVMRVNRDANSGLGKVGGEVYKYEVIDEEAYRKRVTDYMHQMSSIRWRPSIDFHVNVSMSWSNGACVHNRSEKLSRNKIYVGLPYVSSQHSSYEEFSAHCVNQAAGSCEYQVVPNPLTCTDGKYILDKRKGGVVCSSSVTTSWHRYLAGVDWYNALLAPLMIPIQGFGIEKVGPYSIGPGTITGCTMSEGKWDTREICAESFNKKEMLYASYRQLKPGDGVVTTKYGVDTGHVRMVAGNPVIATELGQSTIAFYEQTNALAAIQGGGETSWRTRLSLNGDTKPGVYTFEELFTEKYIPIRHRDFSRGYREVPTVRVANAENPDVLQRIREGKDADNLFGSTIFSNYRIYKGQIEIFKYDSNGGASSILTDTQYSWVNQNQDQEEGGYGSVYFLREIPMSRKGFDHISYYSRTVNALRGKSAVGSENIVDGRYRFIFKVTAGYDEGEIVEDFDFVVGAGAYRRVIYDANGADSGVGVEDAGLYAKGGSAVVLENAGGLALEGYTFAGWNTDPQGSGGDYSPGSRIVLSDGDSRLYAKWTKSEDPGDGVDSGEPGDQKEGDDPKKPDEDLGNSDGGDATYASDGCGCSVVSSSRTFGGLGMGCFLLVIFVFSRVLLRRRYRV